LEKSSIRVLVVDDYEPFRRFICSTLKTKPALQIIGEISDGLKAVHKAEELQPDLILLDIGLPTLNGIEAALRIRNLSPKSKILLVSQESAADVVQEALALGAMGYVVKARAGSELLEAVTEVLEGRQFVSRGLSGYSFDHATDKQAPDLCHEEALRSLEPKKAENTRGHEVEFYDDDAAFVLGFTQFIEASLKAGKAVIAVVTEAHRKDLRTSLQAHGVDVTAATEQGRYIPLDAAETLSAFLVNHLLDPLRFFKVASNLIAPAARATAGGESQVAICGECASILWAQGKADAAIQFERLCNQLTGRYGMNILCGLSLTSVHREEDQQIFRMICLKD
jgi:DNA-binding NarL/FixJ family response regulator